MFTSRLHRKCSSNPPTMVIYDAYVSARARYKVCKREYEEHKDGFDWKAGWAKGNLEASRFILNSFITSIRSSGVLLGE